MKRFKIDFNPYSSVFPFGLFVRKPTLFKKDNWERVEGFETRELAKARYDKIKDLPEYLD